MGERERLCPLWNWSLIGALDVTQAPASLCWPSFLLSVQASVKNGYSCFKNLLNLNELHSCHLRNSHQNLINRFHKLPCLDVAYWFRPSVCLNLTIMNYKPCCLEWYAKPLGVYSISHDYIDHGLIGVINQDVDWAESWKKSLWISSCTLRAISFNMQCLLNLPYVDFHTIATIS